MKHSLGSSEVILNTTNSTTESISTGEIDEADDFLRPSWPICRFAFACSIIFAVVGSVGNLTTVIALIKCRRVRNATTVFVINLAVADFIFCSVNLPLTAVRYANRKWTLGDEFCTVFPFIFYGNVAASLLFMTAITLNRFILINHYQWYDKIFGRINISLIIVFCWVGSFILLIPALFGVWGRFGYKEASFSCTILPSENGQSPKKVLFITGFFVPVATIIVAYSCIFYKVRKTGEKLKTCQRALNLKSVSRVSSHKKREMQITRTMLVIFCTFLLCFLPLMIVNVMEKEIRYPEVHIVSSVLAWMSSCTNPFIYCALSRHYRQAYLSLFCAKRFSLSSSQRSSRGASVDSVHSVFVAEKSKVNRLSTANHLTNNKRR